MKKLIATVLITVLIIGCTNNQSRNAVGIDSKKLAGLYEVDISPLFKTIKDNQNDSNGIESFLGGMALLALNSVDVQVKFFDGNQAQLFVEGDIIEMGAMINGETIKENKFEYRLKNDSIMMVKNHESNAFEYWATIKTDNGNYNKLKLLINNKDIGNVQLNLIKLEEEME